MKIEKIKDLLFTSEGVDVTLRTVTSMKERKLLPFLYTPEAVDEWKHSFVGDYLLHYPDKHGDLIEIWETIDKFPEIRNFTEDNLNKMVAKIKCLAPNSAKQKASQIKSSITRVLESEKYPYEIPCKRYNKILSLDGCPTTKTYMNLDDVKKFINYTPRNTCERVCHARFIVMMMTGARYSDVVTFTKSNIADNVLTYVPQKTKSHGTVVSLPISKQTAEFIEILSNHAAKYSRNWFNKTIRDICKNCGIDEEVTFFWGGKYVTMPKWQAMRSHLGRASFVTNMLKLGIQIQDVSKMAGHTDVVMTSRYNASTDVKLTKEADDFINMKF